MGNNSFDSLQFPQMPRSDLNIMEVARTFSQLADQTFKEMFKGEIRPAFLIEIMKRVSTEIAPLLPYLYNFNFTQEQMVTGTGGTFDYEICKIIIGLHHANTVFLTTEDSNRKMRNPEYKDQLTRQAVIEITLRRYSAAFFRNQAITCGERYIYYPVPYMLFVFCMRINEILLMKGAVSLSSGLLSLITNKATVALSLMEDGFLDSAYMPCRTVIEMYAKLMLLRTDSRLFTLYRKFADFDLDKTNSSGQYSDEFNNLFNSRISQGWKSKPDYMHFGFVDSVDDYHDIVKQNPYSIYGIFTYLKSLSVETDIETYEWLERLYQFCHGYTHGNVTLAKYPLLHYFELSLILGLIIPRVYKIVCEEAGENLEIGFDLLTQFGKDFELLKKQYSSRNTENFELESKKYTYNHRK